MSKTLVIRPKMTMPSTATKCTGGAYVMIRDNETKKMRPLPHIPFMHSGNVSMFHSPTGFSTGYLGSGCSDLAIAICHLFNRVHLADKFKHQVIAKLDQDKDYDIPLIHIEALLEKLQNGKSID